MKDYETYIWLSNSLILYSNLKKKKVFDYWETWVLNSYDVKGLPSEKD